MDEIRVFDQRPDDWNRASQEWTAGTSIDFSVLAVLLWDNEGTAGVSENGRGEVFPNDEGNADDYKFAGAAAWRELLGEAD